MLHLQATLQSFINKAIWKKMYMTIFKKERKKKQLSVLGFSQSSVVSLSAHICIPAKRFFPSGISKLCHLHWCAKQCFLFWEQFCNTEETAITATDSYVLWFLPFFKTRSTVHLWFLWYIAVILECVSLVSSIWQINQHNSCNKMFFQKLLSKTHFYFKG